MAGNDWVNSYLEAILDVGQGLEDARDSSLLLRERGRFTPSRYFVEEVITGFDETDLHRSWVKVYILLIISYHIRNIDLFIRFVTDLSDHFWFRPLLRGVHRRGTLD